MKEQIFELGSSNKLEEIAIAIKEIRTKVEQVLDSSESQKSIKIDQLIQIEKEKYKPLIKQLAYKKSIEEIKYLATVLKDVGDLTQKIGDLSDNLKYYTDAAVLYQYVFTIVEETIKQKQNGDFGNQQTEELYKNLNSIKKGIISKIGHESSTLVDIKEETEKNKKFLQELRSKSAESIKKIESDYEKGNEEAYISASKRLFEEIASNIKEFLGKLYKESEKEIGKLPCQYTVIGLGSMALQQMTPYSDLEFAILTENDHYKESSDTKIKEYFKNLTHLVNLKIINLGETSIPFSKYNLDLDHLIRVAVNFDLGGKTPLGRIENDKPYELIQTVEGMLWYMRNKEDKASHIDKNLPYILEKVCYVYGNKELITQYQEQVKNYLFKETDNENNLNCEARALKVLKEGSIEFNYLETLNKPTALKSKGNIEALKPELLETVGKLFNVKQDIYRLPDRYIYSWGLHYGVDGDNAWDIIDKLKEQEIIKTEAADNLKYAVTFATTLRLKTYLHNKAQKENMSIFSNKKDNNDLTNKIFHLSKEDLEEDGSLFKYFYISLALHKKLEEFCNKYKILENEDKKSFFQESKFYTDDLVNKGLIHYRLAQYEKAQINLKTALDNPENLDSLLIRNTLGLIYANFGKGEEAIKQFQFCLDFYLQLHENNDHSDIASCSYKIGHVYMKQCQYKQAIKWYDDAWEMRQRIYNDKSHKDIADSLDGLGNINYCNGNYTKAIEYHKKSLDMYKYLYKDKSHKDVAYAFTNLGDDYRAIGEYDKAIEYLKNGLEINTIIYKNEPHEDIILCLRNLGITSWDNGDYYKAIEYDIEYLNMSKLLYVDKHPNIADALNNLGYDYRAIGEYNKAIEYYNLSKKMQEEIHKDTPHSRIVNPLNGLGLTYCDIGEYDKAIEYYNLSLDMLEKIHKDKDGDKSKHDDIAVVLNNIGNIYYTKGEYDKAIKYHEESLKMARDIFKNEPHPEIARPLDNLGKDYIKKSDYKKAIECHEESLKMLMLIHKDQDNDKPKPHKDIAFALNSLGVDYYEKGEYDTAISYYSQSLELRKLIYKNGLHPYVADSFINLAEAYSNKDKYNEAIDYCSKALQVIFKFKNDCNYNNIKNIAEKIITTFANHYSLNPQQTIDIILFSIEKEYDFKDCRVHDKFVQDYYANNQSLEAIEEHKKQSIDIFNKIHDCVLNNTFKRQITNFEEIPVKDQSDLRIVSYNITSDYFDQHDKTEDKYHHWQYRAKFVKQLLITLNPDIMCLQEVSLNQAQELVKTFNVYKYKARFLSQHPSEIPAGEIIDEHGVNKWQQDKFTAIPLLGIFVGNSWNVSDVGKFWFNDKSFEEPKFTDRGITDKGFGNMNTYRAVMWIKLEHELDNKNLFVFNSHYPLSGDNKTRYSCAELEMKQIQKISKSKAWISCGDRNLIPTQRDDKTYNPETVYKALTKFGFDVRDAQKHYGISTSFLGFSYDKYCNSVKSGDFTDSSQIDVIISNTRAKHSFTCHGGFDPKTNELLSLSSTTIPDWQDTARSFASDHALIGGDFSLELLGMYNNLALHEAYIC